MAAKRDVQVTIPVPVFEPINRPLLRSAYGERARRAVRGRESGRRSLSASTSDTGFLVARQVCEESAPGARDRSSAPVVTEEESTGFGPAAPRARSERAPWYQ